VLGVSKLKFRDFFSDMVERPSWKTKDTFTLVVTFFYKKIGRIIQNKNARGMGGEARKFSSLPSFFSIIKEGL
jgi:hypothetical protein